MHSRALLASWLLAALVVADPVPFEDCGFAYQLQQVDVEGCSGAPCSFFHDTYTNITAKFHTTYRSDTLRSQVEVKLLSVWHEASTLPARTCDAVAGGCPLQPGLNLEHRGQFYSNPDYVETKGTLEWRLINEVGTSVVCFRLSIKIEGHDPDPLGPAPPLLAHREARSARRAFKRLRAQRRLETLTGPAKSRP